MPSAEKPVTAKRVHLKRVYEPACALGRNPRAGGPPLAARPEQSRAAVDQWLRDLAPSDALRKWFHAHPEAWPLFRKRYLKELAQPESAMALNELYRLVNRRKRLTLLFASRE